MPHKAYTLFFFFFFGAAAEAAEAALVAGGSAGGRLVLPPSPPSNDCWAMEASSSGPSSAGAGSSVPSRASRFLASVAWASAADGFSSFSPSPTVLVLVRL